MGFSAIRRLRGSAREAHAREAIGRFVASGAGRAAFCRREGISPVTLARWLGEFGGATPRKAEGGFVEVRLERPASAGGFDLELSAGRRLRIPPGFDVGDLGRLLALLERAPC